MVSLGFRLVLHSFLCRSTPPPSPGFSYSNEVSYLIRRRSSSSISSADDTGTSYEFDDSEGIGNFCVANCVFECSMNL